MLKRDLFDVPGQDTSQRIVEEVEPVSNVEVPITQVYAKGTKVMTPSQDKF